MTGIEPAHLAALDPKSSVSTSSTTSAKEFRKTGCKYKQYFQYSNSFHPINNPIAFLIFVSKQH